MIIRDSKNTELIYLNVAFLNWQIRYRPIIPNPNENYVYQSLQFEIMVTALHDILEYFLHRRIFQLLATIHQNIDILLAYLPFSENSRVPQKPLWFLRNAQYVLFPQLLPILVMTAQQTVHYLAAPSVRHDAQQRVTNARRVRPAIGHVRPAPDGTEGTDNSDAPPLDIGHPRILPLAYAVGFAYGINVVSVEC